MSLELVSKGNQFRVQTHDLANAQMPYKTMFSIHSQRRWLMYSHAEHHERHKLELLWFGEVMSSLGAYQDGEEAFPMVRFLDGDQSER